MARQVAAKPKVTFDGASISSDSLPEENPFKHRDAAAEVPVQLLASRAWSQEQDQRLLKEETRVAHGLDKDEETLVPLAFPPLEFWLFGPSASITQKAIGR